MKGKIPILLSFYALSNGQTTLTFGQVTYTSINDLSFVEYSRRKTFRTLVKLYRTRAFANHRIVLLFTNGRVEVQTNRNGGFYVKSSSAGLNGRLEKVLLKTGDEVRLVEGLYSLDIHYPEGDTLVVSDIDDTLVHSFIHDKLMKFRTLMFTTMEKRKAVTGMQALLKRFTAQGAFPVYLSNSEQNLYPLIYRFLRYNHFPQGPLFLKQMRKLWDVAMNVKIPPKNTHKIMTLEELLTLFPTRQVILMGDNTQQDVPIYLSVARKFAANIRYIIIRKVVKRKSQEKMISTAKADLHKQGIGIYYADEFPVALPL